MPECTRAGNLAIKSNQDNESLRRRLEHLLIFFDSATVAGDSIHSILITGRRTEPLAAAFFLVFFSQARVWRAYILRKVAAYRQITDHSLS